MSGTKDQQIMKPKSKGSGIMVSDIINEFYAFLLSLTQYESAKLSNLSHKNANKFLMLGEQRKVLDKRQFMAQMKKAVNIKEFKYLKSSGWCYLWVFDHSSYNSAMADDSLMLYECQAWCQARN